MLTVTITLGCDNDSNNDSTNSSQDPRLVTVFFIETKPSDGTTHAPTSRFPWQDSWFVFRVFPTLWCTSFQGTFGSWQNQTPPHVISHVLFVISHAGCLKLIGVLLDVMSQFPGGVGFGFVLTSFETRLRWGQGELQRGASSRMPTIPAVLWSPFP